jgi:hypothetical protein
MSGGGIIRKAGRAYPTVMGMAMVTIVTMVTMFEIHMWIVFFF